jgi:hypothetical protein
LLFKETLYGLLEENIVRSDSRELARVAQEAKGRGPEDLAMREE